MLDNEISGPVRSQREVARILGISLASVQETEHRAMRKLRKHLGFLNERDTKNKSSATEA